MDVDNWNGDQKGWLGRMGEGETGSAIANGECMVWQFSIDPAPHLSLRKQKLANPTTKCT